MENNVFNVSAYKLRTSNPPKINSYITILLLMIIIFIIILFIPYHRYDRYMSYVNNNQLVIIVDNNYFNDKNKELYIDGKKYNYKIEKISDKYIENSQVYYEIFVSIELPKKLNINNNVIEVAYRSSQTNLLKEIIRIFKKGMIK